MNNAQFRKLLETPRADKPPAGSPHGAAPAATPALGSRMRASIPMTPRTLTSGNSEFARQLAERRAALQPTKKFRSSAAPKGSKLAAGYVDRAKARSEQDVEDERLQRLEALKTLYTSGEIEQDEYVRQTQLLGGGDVSSTHLVRGLDRALLERVRKGEDVLNPDAGKKEGEEGEEEMDDEALESKLDEVLEGEVQAVERKREKKHGNAAEKPKTRAEILAELKAARRAKIQENALGSRFRKIGEKREKEKKEETEEEEAQSVRYVMGADGKVKKKIKRSEKERREKAEAAEMPPPPLPGKVMGMMPPPPLKPQEPEPEEDEDIFEGVGEYNPLAGLESDDSEDEEKAEVAKPAKTPEDGKADESDQSHEESKADAMDVDAPAPSTSMPPPSRPKPKIFDTTTTAASEDTYKPATSASSLIASDPALQAALAKAAKIGEKTASKETDEKEKKRKAIQEAADRDAYDIDFGFGGSRDFGDEDDDEYVEQKGAGGGGKRKRGPKKKKGGDKNSAEAVGRVVEEKYGKKLE